MELLILFLLSPAIFAHRYGKANDPNDEPFLPIHPVFPYSPKLMKRGTEMDAATQLTPELYAPKVDARDSYSASFSTNYPRDSYYPNYNPYPRVTTPTPYSSYYSTIPYSYSSTPYNSYNSYAAPYTMTPAPYTNVPYSSSYPNYYYQAPYYYPNYYNQPMFAPPPPSPATDYSDPDGKGSEKNGNKKSKDSDYNQDSSGNQFIDGANYISNSKDLDGQPSTFKASSPQNQVEQVTDIHVKNVPLPLPKTTYRVISVAGQPVGPDYPLPATYAKAQQLEELMSQTWAKLLGQNSQQTGAQTVPNRNDGSYANQNDYSKDNQRYVNLPNVLAKTGLAYVINPNLLGKLNLGQATLAPISQAPTTLIKSTKYGSEKDQTTEQNDYEGYENSSPQGAQNYEDNKQSYRQDQGQAVSYQSQNFVAAQTPQPYSLPYNYNPPQTIRQQSQQYKTNLEDVNFGAKQTNKG